jgi:16S rRNA processing protein RimM
MLPPRTLEVGRIAKAQGLKGEVVVDLVTDRVERLAPGSVLLTATGSLVVRTSRPHQHRFVVSFEGFATREQAEPLAGTVLLAEPLDDPEALWVHELVGAVVREQRSGIERGTVVAVMANPAHDLLELDSGALVPVPFVVSNIDGVCLIDPPEGLFD